MARLPETSDSGDGCDLLHRAVAAVAERWRTEDSPGRSAREVLAHLEVMASAIMNGQVVDRAGLSPAGLALRRRLLDLLRAELLRGYATGSDEVGEGELLRLLLGFEGIREQLDPNWGESFVTRLVGPDGLALVIGLAHDLRSPLTSILFLTDALHRGRSGEINDVQRRQLGIIYSAALSLLSTVSDVVALAQGGDRLADSQPSPFSVEEILEGVRDMILPIAEQKGLSVEVVAPEQDHRLGFPIALSRVLSNLTANASKYTDNGVVELAARPLDDDRLEFSVRDTGEGIPPAVVDQLYEPFRKDTGREPFRFSGSGLGLSISRALVEAMGSELEMETRQGWGTRFHFVLHMPVADPL